MWSWLVIAGLYVAGMGFFHWLGGLGAAADAFQSWGHTVGARRRRPAPPSPS